MSRDGCVALPCGAMVCLRFVIVVFPDHTHLLFLLREHMAQKTHVQSLHICKNGYGVKLLT